MELAALALATLALALASAVASAVALATEPSPVATKPAPAARVFRAVDNEGRILGSLTVDAAIDVRELAAWRARMGRRGAVHIIVPTDR